MRTTTIIFSGILVGCMIFQAPGQGMLNKLKQKAGSAVLDKIGGSNNNQNQGTNPPGDSSNKNNNPSNQTGGGLVTTPPDVNQNLSDADAAYKSGKFGDARYSVQQAMLGVELEIGNRILQSLPSTIAGLNKQSEQDQVTSTGYGWVGLTIHREYNEGKNKEFRVTVANNAAWMSALNMYLSSGGYAQQSGGQQNWKQTKLKGYRAIIEYDQSSGYKLSVPIGQSSLIVYEGVNFASEADMMAAANLVDIESIKKMLGEQ